jgi:hypothetical protein
MKLYDVRYTSATTIELAQRILKSCLVLDFEKYKILANTSPSSQKVNQHCR